LNLNFSLIFSLIVISGQENRKAGGQKGRRAEGQKSRKQESRKQESRKQESKNIRVNRH
jgi:hypothetical protein